MVGFLLAALAIVILGGGVIYWGVFVEREPFALLPGVLMLVFGLLFGGAVWDDYREYKTLPELKRAKAQRYVRCECGTPLRCVECQKAAKKVDEETE